MKYLLAVSFLIAGVFGAVNRDWKSEETPVNEKITASAMWAESGVVVVLPAPLKAEYHNIWIRSGGVTETPEQLSENSWSVPWRSGTIGGALCTEDTCMIFETQWQLASRYLWLKIPLVLVGSFLITFFVVRGLRKFTPWN